MACDFGTLGSVHRIDETPGRAGAEPIFPISTDIEPSKFNQITRLLTTWHLDSRYVMPMLGEPRNLPFCGPQGT